MAAMFFKQLSLCQKATLAHRCIIPNLSSNGLTVPEKQLSDLSSDPFVSPWPKLFILSHISSPVHVQKPITNHEL